MVLLLDNYDSFTFNLSDYLKSLGAEVTVVRNDAMNAEQLGQLNPEGLVISPGPGRPENSGNLMEVLGYFAGKIPVLGICLGHQAIGMYYGGKLVKTAPQHGKVSEIKTLPHPMWRHIEPIHQVCRYHSLCLAEPLPKTLQVTARSKDGVVMAMTHKDLDIWGIQYHPEAILTENGHTLLRNWLNLVYLQQN